MIRYIGQRCSRRRITVISNLPYNVYPKSKLVLSVLFNRSELKMESFTSQEKGDILLAYGAAHGSGREAARIYAERFPNRRCPHPSTFESMLQRLRRNGIGRTNNIDRGADRYVQTVRLEEEVLNEIENNRGVSIRELSRQFHASYETIRSILKENGLHAYHYQRVQHLQEADFPERLNFCHWYLRNSVHNAQFNFNLCFTDESTFTRGGIFNYHNSHIYAEENPHQIRPSNYQHRFSLNVWAGIVGGVDCSDHIFSMAI